MVVRQRTALLRQQTLEGCGFQTMTFAPYVYYTTSAVTSAGVYPATCMRYCCGDAHACNPALPRSVTYQKVEQLSCHSYVSVTVLELRMFMRNTLDFTPTFSVGGCSRACALPRLTKVSLPQGLGQGAWFRKKYAEIVPFRIHIMKYILPYLYFRSSCL